MTREWSFDSKIQWRQHYAWWPKFIDKRLVWRKYYYMKFTLSCWYNFDDMNTEEFWKFEKMTTNPTEYILFGGINGR